MIKNSGYDHLDLDSCQEINVDSLDEALSIVKLLFKSGYNEVKIEEYKTKEIDGKIIRIKNYLVKY